MLKNKSASYFPAAVDDANAGPLAKLQAQLDAIQDSGMTALTIRDILFQKMLDMHSVPKEHFLRDQDTPDRLDDPAIIEQLNALGFYRTSQGQVH
ncbi:hypothetical protein CWB99_15570 [Pseudoalteromonas rubra]|uniref:Uncharacterized protein n=1 Tax=Pseudoalteromonas rubra TaxID=43658 RepID=A0A5S3WL08_9GAMM|nr:hypothetical protein [Pseudoalteromonas rubra]TMP27414.1 hypothetical protein CWB99_15570 [Pseudoalteromonas rubra]TMP36952.1 hypothetical protein CWC00_01455 [Pseudoalteromonas rubra]